MQTSFQVLLVEDNPTEALLIKQMLLKEKDTKFDVQHTTYLKGALKILEKRKFDVILLDLFLEDSKGFETAYEVLKLAKDTAVIVLSSCEDEKICIQSLEQGAQDYIFKSTLLNESLKSRIRYAVLRKKNENTTGKIEEADSNKKKTPSFEEIQEEIKQKQSTGWLRI